MNKTYKFKYGKAMQSVCQPMVIYIQTMNLFITTAVINIFIKTDLDDKVCFKIGMRKIETAMIETMVKDRHDMAVIDNAGLLIN